MRVGYRGCSGFRRGSSLNGPRPPKQRKLGAPVRVGEFEGSLVEPLVVPLRSSRGLLPAAYGARPPPIRGSEYPRPPWLNRNAGPIPTVRVEAVPHNSLSPRPHIQHDEPAGIIRSLSPLDVGDLRPSEPLGSEAFGSAKRELSAVAAIQPRGVDMIVAPPLIRVVVTRRVDDQR